ncbi:papain-like cysteine protease family protein [Acetoanaerobium noterae]|uniref:papain-like cysteine protease family protein n=1 Tax=Acetoanaerobium noterae TaxID=745369 RepID=UPI0028A7C22A|nr:papain-like cysteine protease family protein [Acetoanaerobium noterae]
MKKQIFAFALTALVVGGSIVPSFADDNTIKDAIQSKPEMIKGLDYNEYAGADAYNNAGDNLNSKFYKAPDFYNMVSDEQITIIPKFKTMQQTTEWSCGNVTALMVLENLGIKGFTEMQLAEMMGSSVDKDVEGAKPGSANNFFEYGTNVKQLYDFFSTQKDLKVLETSYIANPKAEDLTSENDGLSTADFGNIKPTFSSSSLYASENSDTTEAWVEDAKDSYFVKWLTGHLKEGRPIMVEWGDWDGHWQAIIGYDNNGTPSIGDDVLVFADPYDTSDHWQDGYYFYPLERWFYMWQDRKVAPKPYQLQPYIVVDTVKN